MSASDIKVFIAALPRMMAKIDRREWDACWPWTGVRAGKGYGKVKVGGAAINAHRAFWQAVNEKILRREEFCCHSCDNPICCNPRHIWIGSNADNMRDCYYKGRSGLAPSAGPMTHCKKGHPLEGENVAVWSGVRRCRTCHQEHNRRTHRASYYRKKAERDAALNAHPRPQPGKDSFHNNSKALSVVHGSGI